MPLVLLIFFHLLSLSSLLGATLAFMLNTSFLTRLISSKEIKAIDWVSNSTITFLIDSKVSDFKEKIGTNR
jgi:hypothetical protein